MLVSMLREKDSNNNYYINLREENNVKIISVVLANNKETRPLIKKEALELLKKILSAKLTYLGKEKDYEVYLDETDNKRYFKDGKEDYIMFFMNNGISAIEYDKEEPENEKEKNVSNSLKLFFISTGVVLFSTVVVQYLGSYLNNVVYEELGYINSEDLSINDIEDYINNSSLTEEQKEILINKKLFSDVLKYSDNSRNYILRKRFKDLNIKTFSNDKTKSGYYDPSKLGDIFINDCVFSQDDVMRHEFIHMLQDSNEYYYIREASAEIIGYEYYGKNAGSYSDEIRRLKVLMEIIGPETVMEVNFKGDTSNFENKIGEYLDEKDTKKLLKLFTTSGHNINNDFDVRKKANEEIDVLLGKMYFNKYNKSIEDDILINNIYNVSPMNRAYFNNENEFYDMSYYSINSKIQMEELSFNSLSSYNISEYIYQKSSVVSEDYYIHHDFENILYTQTEKVLAENVEYDPGNNVYTYNGVTYDYNEAKEMGLVVCQMIVKQNEITSDFNEVEFEDKGTIIIKFNDGTFGEFDYSNEKDAYYHEKLNDVYISNVKHYKIDNCVFPSIKEKFGKDMNTSIYDSNEEELITMLDGDGNEIRITYTL